MKRIVVEVPEPHGKTEDGARAFVVDALVQAQLHPDATVHEERLYWHFRVKSFKRVAAATVERPLDVRIVIELAEAIVRVARGQDVDGEPSAVFIRRALELLKSESPPT